MLKIKQSQVMVTMIEAAGSIALGILLFEITGLLILGYISAGFMFGFCAWILIKIQEKKYPDWVGYVNVALFFVSLVLIAFGFFWAVAIVLLITTVIIGLRFTPENPEVIG